MDASRLPPLTHQELLAHAGAFVRAGWQVNLPASDRAARRLLLQPRSPPPAAAPTPDLPAGPVVETLWLDDEGEGRLRLTRHLQAPGLAPATAETVGASVQALLSRLDAVPLATQFEAAAGRWWALSLHVPAEGAVPVLRRARASLPGLTLDVKVSSVAGYDAELTLQRAPAPGTPAPQQLPDDLFEVIAPAFGRLVPLATGWRSSLALRGGEPGRSRQARSLLARSLEHLDRTLQASPAVFHRRHRAARWRVSGRRSLPLTIGAGLLALALWGALRTEGADAWLGALANGAPPLLLVLLFMRREMLRLELPRPPRPLRPDAWQPPPGRAQPPALPHGKDLPTRSAPSAPP